MYERRETAPASLFGEKRWEDKDKHPTYVSRGIKFYTVRSSLKQFCKDIGYNYSVLYILFADGSAIPVTDFLKSLLSKQRRDMLGSMLLGRFHLLRLSLPNAYFHVFNNVRVFPVGSGLPQCEEEFIRTVKIALSSRSRNGNLVREIWARKLLGQTFPIPAISRYKRGVVTWIEEEWVNSDNGITKAQRVELFLSKFASQLYRRHARPRPLISSLHMVGISSSAWQTIVERAGARLANSLQRKTWPVALIHDDLHPGNMLVSPDGQHLWVADWEGFRRGPVAWDLRKIFRYNPQKIFSILQELGSPDDLSAEDQMYIVKLLERIKATPTEAKHVGEAS